MQFSGIKYGVITAAAAGESANNHSCITFHTWGNSIANTREVARITSRGRLGLNTTAPTELLDVNGNIKASGLLIGANQIYNYLFNNNGLNHNSTTSFTSVDNFGYRFIQGTDGGPATPNTGQYYQWSIGLGNDYAWGSYGAQFALPRNIANPTLSVRFREGNAYGGWSAITAGYLRGNATFSTNQWQTTSDGNNRFYFADNEITYIRGYHNNGPNTANCIVFQNAGGINIIGINNGGDTYFVGQVTCKMYTITNSGTDYIGVAANTANGASAQYTIYVMYGTFTGIHRVFTEDPLFDKEDPQKFKNDYEGRIVVSTGKIATDTKEKDEEDWQIKYDKEGITIEDALPMIELSRQKKDKRVFGVLGYKNRDNSRTERLCVNSLGEGGIWVCNSNGSIENGDYITSSDYLGYGEKQDDDLLHNYTVAKATIDCDFQLDSSLYNCQELDSGIRIAFISCSYHCG